MADADALLAAAAAALEDARKRLPLQRAVVAALPQLIELHRRAIPWALLAARLTSTQVRSGKELDHRYLASLFSRALAALPPDLRPRRGELAEERLVVAALVEARRCAALRDVASPSTPSPAPLGAGATPPPPDPHPLAASAPGPLDLQRAPEDSIPTSVGIVRPKLPPRGGNRKL